MSALAWTHKNIPIFKTPLSFQSQVFIWLKDLDQRGPVLSSSLHLLYTDCKGFKMSESDPPYRINVNVKNIRVDGKVLCARSLEFNAVMQFRDLKRQGKCKSSKIYLKLVLL